VGLATPAVKSAQQTADERPGHRSYAPYLILAGYLLGALYVTARLWADPANVAQGGDMHDVDQASWFMRYAEQAIIHFHLPALVTSAMNAPHTVNLMWNTSLLLPGIVMTPVTAVFGPQVSLTALLVLGFAGSAASLYLVLRRWGASLIAAAIGGAIYGFSPAMITSGIGHYHLVLAMLPPLMIDALLRILTGRGSGVRNGIWLGVLTGAQLFIGEEALIDTAIAAAVLLVVLAACRPRDVVAGVTRALPGLGCAAGVALVLCARGLWVQFHGQHAAGAYTEVTMRGVTYNPADPQLTHLYTIPYAWVVPSFNTLFHTSASVAIADSYPQPLPEYLAYLGIPLIIALLAAGIYYWRLLPVRIAFLTFLVLELLTLGGQPIGPYPGKLLPWYWVQNLPVLSSTLPDRLCILADGAAAAVVAFAFDQVFARLRSRPTEPGTGWWRRPMTLGIGVTALVLLPLVPSPYGPAETPRVPGGYTQVYSALHLSSSARVLLVPVPNGSLTRSMRWIAVEGGVPQDIVGGDFIDAAVAGHNSRAGRAGESDLTRYLDGLWAADNPLPPQPTQAQVENDMRYWQVSGIMADTLPGTPLADYLIKEFGPPTVEKLRVMGWRLGPNHV
jgi:hypothetical protein